MPISMTLLQKIKESADYIRSKIKVPPAAGIILGSGLGSFAAEVDEEISIPYTSIPHFPIAGVEGHKGSLLFGRLTGVPVVLMQGRIHYYEGFPMEVVTFPVRVLKQLGIRNLLLTNAAGGMNPDFMIGDLMIIQDHINMMPNPLIGENVDELGPRFPDMSEAYDPDLIAHALRIAEENGIQVHKGVYLGVTGPCYETPAEYKYFRIIGGDAVGMSTVPEVIAARHMDIHCFGLSVITDLGIPGRMEYITHQMVQKAAGEAEPRVAVIIRELTGMLMNA